jgi:polyphosphate kinase 2 (PPK2 family)
MSAMNPHGVHVRPFMAPSATELRHHFLWRFKKELPEPRHITIFNRSYYEDVLIARVKALASFEVIESRYEQTNRFEAGLVRSNVIPVKICLAIRSGSNRLASGRESFGGPCFHSSERLHHLNCARRA